MIPCKLCNDQRKRDEADARLAFDFTIDELAGSSSDHECASCTVILQGVRQSLTSYSAAEQDVRRVYARCSGAKAGYDDSLCLEIYFVDDRPKLELEFYSLGDDWKSILPRTSTNGDPLSTRSLSWVKNLLDECDKLHVSCKRPETREMPKRILSVGDAGNGAIVVRLVESKGQQISWVALSHCWGHSRSCITTSETLNDRKHNIPWHTIPKTFQDAISYTIKLGLNYIWIDSLCIVQDDAADWEIESSKMADIYQNAYLTLSATASSGDSQGCFPSVDSALLMDSTLNAPGESESQSTPLAVRRSLKHWNNISPRLLEHQFPLLSRAWAFQERLLTSRILHFCEAELVWECRGRTACECGVLNGTISPGAEYYGIVRRNEESILKQIAGRPVHFRSPSHASSSQYDVSSEIKDNHSKPSSKHKKFSFRSRALAKLSKLSPKIHQKIAQKGTHHKFLEERLPSYEIALPSIYTPADTPRLAMIHHFHHIVEQYSALRLTIPDDRLPALSGFCARIQHLRGTYFAGLWSDSICYDLLWRINTLSLDTENAGRPLKYRGPSWSWVSANSPISYWSDIVNFDDPNNLQMHLDMRNRMAELQRMYAESSALDYPNLSEDARKLQRKADRDVWDHVNKLMKMEEPEPLGQHQERVQAHVNRSERNPFGQVSSATLTAEASTIAATLLYTTISHYDPRTSQQTVAHDPARYKLEIMVPQEFTISESKIEIPFFADYVLSANGPHKVSQGAGLTLLQIHPKVALVLRGKFEGDEPVMIKGEPVWERIGIARISDAFVNHYRVDWMRGAQVARFRIE